MEVGNGFDGENIPLCHVVSVLSDEFLRFCNVDSIEHAVLQNAADLLTREVGVFTVYDARGILRRHFMTKYGGCSRCSVVTQPKFKVYELGFLAYSNFVDSFECSNDADTNINSSYLVEREGSEVFLSEYDPSQHPQRRGLRLCFLDRSHAHQRILRLSLTEHPPPEDWIDTPGVFLRGKQVKYRIPSEHQVSQPDLQRQLHLIDGVELPTADLVVSVQPRLRDAALFFIAFIFLSLLQLVRFITPWRFKPTMPPKLDFKLLLRCIAARVGSVCFFGGSVIYSFGPDGIPPFFLAESELHQCFGLTVAAFSRCVDRYYTCQRRKGK
ncbi:acetylornithine aminotransferase [Babesia ovata]|uniref:Acetylornithine aminotransferase n=1 Tax=Babesia ovata TaxID=189622 RepID=A0A2H6KD15_9APIC|nr:acetylornithine aminotransferase [Babesia ovata]GBE60890.1 acetylornithine aminotransferase [Babesia ovata]